MNNSKNGIQFWLIMAMLGAMLIIGGMILAFLRLDPSDSQGIVFEMFGARFEGNDVGLALVAMGLIACLIGYKERTNLRKYSSIEERLTAISTVATDVATQFTEERDSTRQKSSSKREELKKRLIKVKNKAKDEAIDYAAIKEVQKVLELSREIDLEN